jgi:hypothetical protein
VRDTAPLPPHALAALFVAVPLGVIAAFSAAYVLQWRRGPWLILDTQTNSLDLPRRGVRIERAALQRFTVVSGLIGQGGAHPERVSEVHALVLEPDGSLARHGIAGTLDVEAARKLAAHLKQLLQT